MVTLDLLSVGCADTCQMNTVSWCRKEISLYRGMTGCCWRLKQKATRIEIGQLVREQSYFEGLGAFKIQSDRIRFEFQKKNICNDKLEMESLETRKLLGQR